MEDLQEKVKKQVHGSDVVLYMKGTPQMPQCGFSAQVVEILRRCGVTNYASYDVLESMDFMAAVKKYSNWPTNPQLYIRGEFIGGCDITTELYQKGELQKMLDGAGSKSDEN
ncbi:MAG: Grx4 family monothiol glutaredoxin [Planctomycetes bacterium]|nr:Grx4 family monothiol glutaredoxin [Planctomycetota bacterium]